MSEAKERPTMAEADTQHVVAESSAVSGGAARSERAGERSSARPVKDVVVTVRMTTEDADALAFVQAEFGATSGPDALREGIKLVAALLRGEDYRSAKAQRPVVDIDEALLTEVRDAVREVTTSYNKRTRELQFIGHNWNQIAKVANATGAVDTDAILGVERALEGIRRQMTADAERDAKALAVLACLS
ncbi:plasmid mobilization relaxosome protein MobC [Cryobacterium sp. MDB1-18-2]|uniref:plasmid mobilization relaxosome protein MobC n=1 Tax=unclassified Cryobacterium TaxID=2649013 RepID=UPI00106AE95C|nr:MULTISPECIES: plasmid mobilization relaxosome protein MobC [unclassified Cryobacterium]TFC32903.1 plasmid mobilization relaxosome protein MobC [Cryobacterium sp. MDB1-18-2]TFC44646.1 plasmid mobilization relaxosome protein MobC [Cryobacterium sp. MDB1-18-1]